MDVLRETLSVKEKANLNKLFELYDNKKYKKGLKLVDKLLEKGASMPEYCAMRALFWLHTAPEAAEALSMAKDALKSSLNNPFSWHTCGTIYQKMQNYKEAGKCFERVVKLKPQSLSALRSTTNLQLHTRDYLAYRDTCHKALLAHPEMHHNWAAYALALRLLHQFTECVVIMDELIALMRRDAKSKADDLDGLLQFKAETLREAGKREELAAFLRAEQTHILNEELQFRLELWTHREVRDEAAQKLLAHWLELNPHNAEVAAEFFRTAPGTLEEKLRLLEDKRSLCAVTEFLKLEEVPDDIWQREFERLYDNAADRFVPSFTRIARQLGRLPGRHRLVEDTLVNRQRALASSPQPVAELFSLFVLAAWRYVHGQFAEALELAEQACSHTPSFEDALILKAKILLAQGHTAAAAAAARFAARLNTADRALATAACRLLFRANRFDEADRLFKQFLKGDEAAVEKNLHELQMEDFERMRARALLFRRQWTAALRQYEMLDEHFNGYFEDQLDFYSYGLRRFSPQALYEIVKLNDGGLHRHRRLARNATEYLCALLLYQDWTQHVEQADEAERMKIKEAGEQAAFCLPACVAGHAALAVPLAPGFAEKEIEKLALRLLRFNCEQPQPELHAALLRHFLRTERWLAAGRSALHLLKCPPTAARLKALSEAHQRLRGWEPDAPVLIEVVAELAAELQQGLASYQGQLDAGPSSESPAQAVRGLRAQGRLAEAMELLRRSAGEPGQMTFAEAKGLMEVAGGELPEPLAYYSLAAAYFSEDPEAEGLVKAPGLDDQFIEA